MAALRQTAELGWQGRRGSGTRTTAILDRRPLRVALRPTRTRLREASNAPKPEVAGNARNEKSCHRRASIARRVTC